MEKLTNIENYSEKLLDLIFNYLPKIGIAILTLAIGFWLANRLSSILKKYLTSKVSNPSVIPFLASIVSTLMKILVIISVAGKFGIQTTSFIAMVGGLSVAIGLAVKDNLSNLTSGVMILFFKPYKIGDKITTGAFTGTVHEILIFNTVLITGDNKKIIIPNNSITSAAITNFTETNTLKSEINFKVSGTENINKVKTILLDICNKDERILQSPAPTVTINAEDLNTTIFKVGVWSHSSLTSAVVDYINEEAKMQFMAQQIEGPKGIFV